VTLHLPDNLPLYTDQIKVRQILINLLSNASKFTRSGSIAIAAALDAGTGDVRVSVEDCGIGIPNHLIESLFEPFVQADASTTRKYGGTGLGLPISRRFSRLLGGDLTVESTPGLGSTFTMRIPATLPNSQAQHASSAVVTTNPEQPLSGEGIAVVVDDDSNTRTLLARVLKKQGLRVMECSSGEEGFEAVKRYRPLFVTLDIQMDGIDGWTMLSKLKSDEEVNSIPVIVITVLEDKLHGLRLGAAEYLTKPINSEALTGAVQRCRQRANIQADGSLPEVSHA